MSDRIEFLKKRVRADKIPFSVEKAVLFTGEYQRQAGQPEVLRTALAQAYVLDHIPIFIIGGELIVGNPAAREMAIEADFWNKGVWTSEGIESLREEGTYAITQDQANTMHRLSDYWREIITDYKVLDSQDEEMWRWRKSGFLLPANRTYEEAAGMGFAGNGYAICGDAADINQLDYQLILSRGLEQYISDIDAELSRMESLPEPGESERKKADFLRAARVVHLAVIRFAGRFAALAEKQAGTCGDPVRRQELCQIASNCRRVPAQPPRTFWEALQFLWFLFLMCVNRNTTPLERFDQYMLPYYEADRAVGKAADEEVLELLQCFRLKFMQLKSTSGGSTRKKWSGHARWNNMTIGGVTPDGRDATTPLSYLVLEAAFRCQVPHHTITLRVHNGTPEALMLAALKLVRTGLGMPAFVGDRSYIESLRARGVPLEKARDYYMIGCIDPNVPEGFGHVFSMIVPPLAFDTFLHNGRSPHLGLELGPRTGDVRDMASFDLFFETFLDHLDYYLRYHAKDFTMRYELGKPVLQDAFTASLYSDGVRVGKIGRDRDMPYGLGPTMDVGVGAINLADSLYAVKHLVYDTGRLTMGELLEALDDNWQSEKSQEVRALCLSLPKYGNNVPEVDAMARRVYRGICRRVFQLDSCRGTKYNAGAISITAYEPGGALVGATPDGRGAGETLADGCASPIQGMDRKGLTSVLASALAIDQDEVLSMLLNIKIHPTALKTEDDLRKLGSMIIIYCREGGKHIQFNVVDKETLLQAKAHPESYENLVVRVAGYSAYFTQLSPTVQDEVIQRTEHELI